MTAKRRKLSLGKTLQTFLFPIHPCEGERKMGVMEITREGERREGSMRSEESEKPISCVKSDLCRWMRLVFVWLSLSDPCCPLVSVCFSLPASNQSIIECEHYLHLLNEENSPTVCFNGRALCQCRLYDAAYL